MQARKPWLLELTVDSRHPPKHWPKHLPWSKYGRLWRQTLQRVAAWQQGTLTSPCPHGSTDWDMRGAEHVSERLVPVSCRGGSDFGNVFYRPAIGGL